MDDANDRSDAMEQMAMDTPSQSERDAIETDTRFFMRLLLGAGIVAAALVAGGIVWHESELDGGSQATQVQTPPVSHE